MSREKCDYFVILSPSSPHLPRLLSRPEQKSGKSLFPALPYYTGYEHYTQKGDMTQSKRQKEQREILLRAGEQNFRPLLF
jgi:hypothetical protein